MRRSTMIVFIIFLSLFLVVGCRRQQDIVNPVELLAAGDRLLAAGDYQQAVTYFQQVVLAEPRFSGGYLRLAHSLIALGRYPEAYNTLARGVDFTGDREAMLLLYDLQEGEYWRRNRTWQDDQLPPEVNHVLAEIVDAIIREDVPFLYDFFLLPETLETIATLGGWWFDPTGEQLPGAFDGLPLHNSSFIWYRGQERVRFAHSLGSAFINLGIGTLVTTREQRSFYETFIVDFGCDHDGIKYYVQVTFGILTFVEPDRANDFSFSAYLFAISHEDGVSNGRFADHWFFTEAGPRHLYYPEGFTHRLNEGTAANGVKVGIETRTWVPPAGSARVTTEEYIEGIRVGTITGQTHYIGRHFNQEANDYRFFYR